MSVYMTYIYNGPISQWLSDIHVHTLMYELSGMDIS